MEKEFNNTHPSKVLGSYLREDVGDFPRIRTFWNRVGPINPLILLGEYGTQRDQVIAEITQHGTAGDIELAASLCLSVLAMVTGIMGKVDLQFFGRNITSQDFQAIF